MVIRSLPIGGLVILAACAPASPPERPLPTVSVAVPLQREVADWDEFVGQFEDVQDTAIASEASGIAQRMPQRLFVLVAATCFREAGGLA